MLIPGADIEQKIAFLCLLYFGIRGAITTTGDAKQDFMDTVNGIFECDSYGRLGVIAVVCVFWLYGIAMGM